MGRGMRWRNEGEGGRRRWSERESVQGRKMVKGQAGKEGGRDFTAE